MLKKVMTMLTSKYLAIKVRIRAIETRLMIQSLLLRDKKMVQHLFRRKCFDLSKVGNEVEDEDYQSENTCDLLSNSTATTSVSVVQLADEADDMMETEDDNDYADSRHSPYEEAREEDQSVSVIEMVKNVKEVQGKAFKLEEDIDQVADLFIQRFHHQIRLQRTLSEGSPVHWPV